MKWLSKKGIRGIAYFMIMMLVFTSVISGDVMRAKADPAESVTISVTFSGSTEAGAQLFVKGADGWSQTNSFTAAPGDNVNVWLQVNEGYDVNMQESGCGAFSSFTLNAYNRGPAADEAGNAVTIKSDFEEKNQLF